MHSDAVRADFGLGEAGMQEYGRAGDARAMKLGNCGPIRFAADGSPAEDILEAY
jgi:hypothetical protein